MKLKRLTMVFEQPLDKIVHYQGQDVTQEDILMADVEGIRKKVKRELDKVLRSINMIRILNPLMFDVLKFHVQGLEHRLVWMISFNKITPTKYEFVFPTDANALLTIKDFASKLGPLKKFALGRMENQDLQLVKILREQELINAFERFSFKEMHLEPGTWAISNDEFESDLEGESVGSKETQLAGETGGNSLPEQGAKVEPAPPADNPQHDPENTEGKPDRDAMQ